MAAAGQVGRAQQLEQRIAIDQREAAPVRRLGSGACKDWSFHPEEREIAAAPGVLGLSLNSRPAPEGRSRIERR